MGSPLRLTVLQEGPSSTGRSTAEADADADAAWLATVTVFEAAEAAMSRFRDTSELTLINRAVVEAVERGDQPGFVRPTPMLRRALVAADRAHRSTAGRFDPRVIGDLDRLGYRGAALATDGDAARTAPIMRPDPLPVIVRHGRDELRLPRPVDLGGIGKGLTLRWAADAIRSHGIEAFLLEAGGDIVASGVGPDDDAWSLGIEDPAEREPHVVTAAVTDAAVATSSIAVNRWTSGDRTVHHLIDPWTGEPADTGLLSVTVSGPDPAWAEVWSKVLFLSGRTTIASEARSRGLAAWWVTDDRSLEMTPAARSLTTWVASEAGRSG